MTDLNFVIIIISSAAGFVSGFISGWLSRSRIVRMWHPGAPWATVDYAKWFKTLVAVIIIAVFLYISVFNPDSIGNAFTIVVTVAISSLFGLDIYDLIDRWRGNDEQ